MNKNYDYKRLTPFKWFVLQNFPFIDEDFDAITNYQLFCKLGEEINKLIESMNQAGLQVEELTNYVNNFFDNLDVQDEIDNKLDEMAESGQLTDIIAQYLQLAGLLCFNTKTDLKNAQNLSDGSFAKTYGTLAYNDGYGYFYKIREIQNTDIVDDDNIIALTNYNNLIAEKIIDANTENLKNQVNSLINKKYIFIGDSYNTTDTPEGGVPIVPWGLLTAQDLGLTANDYYNFGHSGAGWVRENNTFLGLLQSNESSITNKDEITDIVVMGGINDSVDSGSSIYNTGIKGFYNYMLANYPNAKLHIAMCSWTKSSTGRNKLKSFIQWYNLASTLPKCSVIPNAYTWFHNYRFYQPDGHPNENGSSVIAQNLANYLKTGNTLNFWNEYSSTENISSSGNTIGITNSTIGTLNEILDGDKIILSLKLNSSLSLQNSDFITSAGHYKIGVIPLYFASFDVDTPIAKGTGWVYPSGNTGQNYRNINYTLYANGYDLKIRIDNADENAGNKHLNPTVIAFDELPDIILSAINC